MANTVSILTYANTFGDWVVTTNALTKENNDLAANNFIKSTGTLFLNDSTLGLQVAKNAIVAGQLQVQGTGSSAYIQNNLTVDKQVYFANTIQSLYAYGAANVAGTLNATGSGTGLYVANDAIIAGTLAIGGLETVGGTLNISGSTTVSNNITVTGFANATSNINTSDSFNAVNYITARDIVSSNSVNTYFVTAHDVDIAGNTNIYKNINIVGNTVTSSVQANNTVNTTSLSVTTTSFTNKLQANTLVNTPTLSVSGTEYVDTISANTVISSPKLTVTNLVDANNAVGYFSSIQTTGQVSVGGNFVINGTTVYSTNTFTLNAGSATGQLSYLNVNRGSSGSNASIRWSESSKLWDMLDVNDNVYYRILHNGHLSSSGALNNTSNVATSAAVYSSNTFNQTFTNTANTYLTNYTNTANTYNQNYTISANSAMKVYVDSSNTSMKSYVDTANTSLKSYVDNANTAMKTYVDTKSLFTPAATFQSDLTVTGNLIINGATTTVNTNTVVSKDSLLKLADGNAADSLDIGFYGQYNSSGTKYAGLFRKAADKFYLVKDVTTDPTTNSVTFTSSNRAVVDASLTGGTVSGLSSAISVSDGGTGVGSLTGVAYGNGTGAFTAATGSQIVTAIGTSAVGNATTVVGTTQSNITSIPNLTTVGTINTGTWAGAFASVSGANLTNLTAGNLTGTIPSAVLGNSTHYVGTTAITLNRASGSQTLTGVNIDGTAGSVAWTNVTSRPTNLSSFTNDLGNYGNWITASSNQNTQVYSLGVGTGPSGTAGEIRATNNIIAYYSDERLKTKLGNIDNALTKVMSLNGFYYEANQTAQDLGYNVKKEVGVSAQEVQAILPEIVLPAPIDEKYLTVQYDRLVPLLIEAIKELKAEVDSLKQKE